MTRALVIHYDPKLVEEAVFHAQRDSYVATDIDDGRRRIYGVSDPEERERLFQQLYREWFARLRLGEIIETTVHEHALISALVDDCYVVSATLVKQEGAELFVAPDAAAEKKQRHTLRILIRPESLLEPESAIPFLRHELYHIADMLDPAFAYEPALPRTSGGPTYDTLITNRYRVLWDVTISGRMMHRGWLPQTIRDRQLKEFHQAFPMLEEASEKCFARFFDGDHPRHAEMAAFALDPRAASGLLSERNAAGTHCPLCRFPSHSFEREPEKLDVDVLAAITRDFPGWTPALGLCLQCADLYRASRLSMAAAKALPGWSTEALSLGEHRRNESPQPSFCKGEQRGIYDAAMQSDDESDSERGPAITVVASDA